MEKGGESFQERVKEPLGYYSKRTSSTTYLNGCLWLGTKNNVVPTERGISWRLIVVSTISLSLRANKKQKSVLPQYDWSLLTTNSWLKDQYTIAVGNKFEAMQADVEAPSSNTMYNNSVTSHEEAAKYRRRIPWESDNIASQRVNVKKKDTIKNSNPSPKSIQDLNKALQCSAKKFLRSSAS